MKCFFALAGNDRRYYNMVKVLVLSARGKTELELYCVYDGYDLSFTDWLKSHDVTVLKWTITFFEDLAKKYNGQKTLEFCRGTYLCMEIPKVAQSFGICDEFILYVDTDTMFANDVRDLVEYKPLFFACSTDWQINDWSRFSTGVIVMNVPNLLNQYPLFLLHLKEHNYNFEYAKMGPCDQGAWNTFYQGMNAKLDPIYDWKPWWGPNKNAKIIHFSGPKPDFCSTILHTDVSFQKFSKSEYLNARIINDHRDGYEFFLEQWLFYI